MNGSFRVLSLQPYYGGSHRQFNDAWARHSEFQWTTLSLPPRHWKWRMRHAGIYFADAIARRMESGESWDVIFCSDMMNLAEFKGLSPSQATSTPMVMYFHENQFAYPNQYENKRDLHFAFTNFVSALAAEQVWFNSRFNLQSFFNGLESQAEDWPDFVPGAEMESLKLKTRVFPPGIDATISSFTESQSGRLANCGQRRPIHLLWAARWEHDKNPAGLMDCLEELERRGMEFRISVIGQSFRETPVAIKRIRENYSRSIVRWGYQGTRAEYLQALSDADVFVSTAIHEFFGIAAAEAIAAGLYPLLPDRLAYPELIGLATIDVDKKQFFYDGTTTALADRICELIDRRNRGDWTGTTDLARPLTDRLNWERCAADLDVALANVIEKFKV